MYRGNFVFFGLVIVDSLYGKESLGIVLLLIVIVILIFNVIVVILLEYYLGNEVNKIKLIK